MSEIRFERRKKDSRTCSECRHAQTATVNRKWQLICILGKDLEPCSDFKDARVTTKGPE